MDNPKDRHAKLEKHKDQLLADERKAKLHLSEAEETLANSKLAKSAPSYARLSPSQISDLEQAVEVAKEDLRRIQEELRICKAELRDLNNPNFGLPSR